MERSARKSVDLLVCVCMGGNETSIIWNINDCPSADCLEKVENLGTGGWTFFLITNFCDATRFFTLSAIGGGKCEEKMGLNEAWRVSQLSYTKTNAGVKRQRGNLCRKSDKSLTGRVGMRGQWEQRWQGMYEKQLAFISYFFYFEGDKTFIHFLVACTYVWATHIA